MEIEPGPVKKQKKKREDYEKHCDPIYINGTHTSGKMNPT